MEKKKIYRIRKKGSNEFLSLGYKQRSTWFTYPTAVIRDNQHILGKKEEFEVVLFEYELKETKILELK